MRTGSSCTRTLATLGLAALVLPAVLAAEPTSGPFRFATQREGPRVTGTAAVTVDGKQVDLGSREGELPAKGLLVESADRSRHAVVLWLEASTGRQGHAVVYSLPAGRTTTVGEWFDRAGLEPAKPPGLFAITAPLRSLDLPPPWLRSSRVFELRADALVEVANTKSAPASPGQELEWAADELASGRPRAALDLLEKHLLAAQGHGDSEELAAALELSARACVALGDKSRLMVHLERLRQDLPATPAGQMASEALGFIEANGADAYLARERR